MVQWMWHRPRRAEDLGCGPGTVTLGTSLVPHQKVAPGLPTSAQLS